MKYLKLFERFDENLLEEITEFDYYSIWKKRIIGPPNPSDILIIREQISKIESSHFKTEYYKFREKVWGTTYEYHRKPGYYFRDMGYTDLYVDISLCDDDWYIIRIYSDWRHYYYLCDTSDGLKGLADVVIQKLAHH